MRHGQSCAANGGSSGLVWLERIRAGAVGHRRGKGLHPRRPGTYRQWSEAGAQIRRAEKSAYVVFYKKIPVAADDGNSEETKPMRPTFLWAVDGP
jgi:hypothetical protein